MIRLGTRASALALAQSGMMAAALRKLGAEVELVPMRTEGDRLLAAPLTEVGGKGLFVKEIEEALLDGRVDVAVHSLKDLPAELPRGLCLAAFPPREDPRDVLVTASGGGVEDLGRGARVGTSSPRRRAVLLQLRPDLAVEPLRGNVDTRLRKLERGDCDAIILAAAGLARLGLAPAHARPLGTDVFVPAVGQGILAVETREDDRRVRDLVGALDDAPTRPCALAERAFLARLGASCNTPVAAHARLDGAALVLTGIVVSPDGRRILRASDAGPRSEAAQVGRRLAESLLARGAASLAALEPERGA